jgi:serine/threonine protein kinase
MTLAAGVRLGPYEILSALGAGGMGEVYRARDATLNRDVALKVLPELFALDLDRLARFKREAQVLASLNHPNIAHVYGLEDSQGVRALVMELVEGPTLADRIAQGAIPFDDALPIAKQIALALEAAHEQGVVHRDLKPANIKVRPDGTVKVLDFGLAKAIDPQAGTQAAALANSPTLTSPTMMTGVGVILGTAAYMSPEQAKGRAADKRSDVWAFGCVFYEMLTGRRAFYGEDVSDTLAAVLKGEPDWTALPADVPPAVRALIQGCLRKDRKERIGDISTALFVLGQPHAVTQSAPIEPRPILRRAMFCRGRCAPRRSHCDRDALEARSPAGGPGDPIRGHAAAGAAVDAGSTSPRLVAGRHTHRVRRRWRAVSPVDVGSRGQADLWNQGCHQSGVFARRPIAGVLCRFGAQANCHRRRDRPDDLSARWCATGHHLE